MKKITAMVISVIVLTAVLYTVKIDADCNSNSCNIDRNNK